MNKKLQALVLVLIVYLMAIGANAQPIISDTGFNPRIGESHLWQQTNFHSSTLPNVTGPNKVWDFSNLKDTGIASIISFVPTKGVKMVDSFPTSNLVLKGTSWQSIEFDKTTSTFWGQVGYYYHDSGSSYSNLERYTPARPYMIYPMSYNKIYTDSIIVNYIDSPYNASISTSYDTLIGVGYGTLKLPKATYNNVLLVKNAQGNLGTSYWFVTNGVHFPLLILGYNYYDSNGIITDSSWGATYNAGTPLPLEIASFSASLQNNSPLLQWEVTNTSNTKDFNIQRSIDGKSFENVGFVGIGNTTNYSFSDDYTPTSTIFYRLKQIDKDGSEFYSKTVSLQPDYLSSYSIFPNPAKDAIHISIPAGNKVAVYIYDIAGKLVYQNNVFAASDAIETAKWTKGSYVVKIKDNAGWQVRSLEKE